MGYDELLVLEYLKRFPDSFISASQIYKEAAPQERYATEPQWARRALESLIAGGHLETDESGHYRVAPALLAKYIEYFQGARRVAGGCKAVATRIMEMAPEDDEKTFDALIREALVANRPDKVG